MLHLIAHLSPNLNNNSLNVFFTEIKHLVFSRRIENIETLSIISAHWLVYSHPLRVPLGGYCSFIETDRIFKWLSSINNIPKLIGSARFIFLHVNFLFKFAIINSNSIKHVRYHWAIFYSEQQQQQTHLDSTAGQSPSWEGDFIFTVIWRYPTCRQ